MFKSFLFIATLLVSVGFSHADDHGIPKEYPLTICPVSKEKLGSGKMIPFRLEHDGTEVWLCCKACVRNFNRKADEYVALVREAAKK